MKRFGILALGIWLAISGVALVLPNFAHAQGITTGSISGTVLDPQGAVLAKAKVTAVETATNRTYTANTTDSGIFALRSLPIGSYDVKIDAVGFRVFESKGVQVSVGSDTSLGAVKMEVGTTTESVTVEGTTPLVESTSDQIESTFDSKKVESLPIGNTYDSLALFLPGVATAGDASFSNNNGAELSVNGLRARANNFQLDGQSNNDNSIAGPSIFFGNQDAISEVQVVTNYDAEFGRNSGAVVNYVTKSGTNEFHGTLFEFYQGSKFDSLTNQEKNPLFGYCLPGQSASSGCITPTVTNFVDNRFGGTIGGPVKRDKIWFFGSANLERQRTGGSPQSSAPGLVPTPTGVQQLQTDFPNSPAGALYASIGPTAVSAGNPTFSNIQNIPVTGPNGVTQNIQFGSITRFVPTPFNDYEATGRVDFKLTEKDNFFARYIYQKQYNGGVNFGNGVDVGDWQEIPGLSQQIGLDWVRSFNNTFVNQVRASYSRASSYFNEQSFPTCVSNTPTACPTDLIMAGGAPQDSVSFGVAAGFPQGRVINVYQLQDNGSVLKGHHTIKFGGEISQQRSPNVFLPENNGVFVYGSFNDLVANNVALTQIAFGSPILPFSEWDLGFYGQDNWQIRDNLTLNLGIRWDWFQQAVNLLNTRSVKQQTGNNPFWDTSLPLSLTTVPRIPQRLHNFAPVLGFAWTPDINGSKSTVLRGGFRMAYDPAFYNMFLNVATSAPSVNLTNLSAGLPSNGFFGTQLIPYLASTLPAAKGNPGNSNQVQVPQTFRNPYSEQWNIGIQHSFTSKVVLEVRYVGNHAVGLFQANNGNPALGPLIAAGFQNVIPAGYSPCTNANAPGSSLGFANCNFTNVIQYANTATSNYNGIQNELRIAGWKGLSATASYTFSKTIDTTSEIFGTTAGGNTVAESQNPFDNANAERGNSGTDFPHVAGVTIVYDLPFYSGQHGFKGHALGGWQINTTYRYTSGQPYTVIQSYTADPFGEGSLCDPGQNWGGRYDACRPILANPSIPYNAVTTAPGGIYAGVYCGAGQCPSTTGTLAAGTLISLTDPCLSGGAATCTPIPSAHWIRNDANAAAVYGTPFAGASRNIYRGQPISTANLAIFKNTKITERTTLQFQAQAFNVMNVQFRGVPNPVLDNIANGSFGNTNFNFNGGSTFAGNIATDGIAQRRLLFGLKLIF